MVTLLSREIIDSREILAKGHLVIQGKELVSSQIAETEKRLNLQILSYRLSSLFYYLLAAEAGFEVGNFNLAYLFEEYQAEIADRLNLTNMSYHFYNQSISDVNQASGYALNKMGDYHYVMAMKKSSELDSSISMAAQLYAMAYVKGEPQGLFNLGLLVEEGVRIPGSVWDSIQIQYWTSRSKHDQLQAIYLK